MDCQARYPRSEPTNTADQNATTPIIRSVPGKIHPDIRPAKKDAIAAIKQPNKKIGMKYSWYGVMSSDQKALVPVHLNEDSFNDSMQETS